MADYEDLAEWNNNSFVKEFNISDFPQDELSCLKKYAKTSSTEGKEKTCSPEWDSFYCWPPVEAGSLIPVSCENIFSFLGETFPKEAYAYRECGLDGEWVWGNWTNYTACMNLIEAELISPITVSYILLIGSIISLLCLIISLFIFSYFKSLQCSRIQVHRNLISSLILHSIIMLVISLPGISESLKVSFKSSDWFCKVILILKMYSAMTCIYWMFVEGHLLHSSITVSVFGNETPFIFYYAVGWGIPLVFVLIWIIVTVMFLETRCWKGYGKSLFIWLVTGPMIVALLINSVFLVNIIRILITKLKMSTSLEMKQVKKAVKATLLLFPLLGITHLLFCINPRDDAYLEQAYMITNAILQSSQGLFVAMLYCFLNSEVQAVLKNAYLRASERRNPERSFRRSNISGSVTNTTALTHGYEHLNGDGNAKDKEMTAMTTVRFSDLDEDRHPEEKLMFYEKETSFIN